MAPRVHLVLLGPHTRVVASLCAACPHGPEGCCTSPPDLSWTDIGRVASLGGVAWLVAEVRSGRLLRGPRGLVVERIALGEAPRTKCVYHGEQGCSIPPERRSAACNYYVCGEALAEAGPEATGVEAGSAAWTTAYQIWDEILSSEVGGWERHGAAEADPTGLFEALGLRFRELAGGGDAGGEPAAEGALQGPPVVGW